VARDTSFYYSFLVLPAAKRQAIVAVWDFCRAVDDAVDEAPVGTSAAQVARWREELARCFDGRPPETPQGRALQPLVPAFNLPDENGNLVSLSSLLRLGPAVISFNRGHWCPYCRINTRALAEAQTQVASP